jgi:hypothetical protein
MQNVKLRWEKSGGEEIKKFTGCLEVPGQARNALVVLFFERDLSRDPKHFPGRSGRNRPNPYGSSFFSLEKGSNFVQKSRPNGTSFNI